MTASAVELAGIVAGCAAAALAVLATRPGLRLGAIGVALVIAPVLIAGDVWNEPRVERFRSDSGAVVAAAGIGAVVIAALAMLVHRLPAAFPVLAFAVLGLRVPVDIGGETANLLIPLYGVVAAAAISGAWRLRSGPRPGGEVRVAGADPPPGGRGAMVGWPPRGATGWLRWLLAVTLLLYAAQTAYSHDVSNAIEYAGFFLIPFAAMFALLLEVAWSRRLLGMVLAAIGGMALIFAGVAIYQYVVRDLFLNDELLQSNQIHQYFRVNSLFFDPNILGRYLALGIVALAAYVAWGADRRGLAAATVTASIALAGIAFSFSITSIAALVAGLCLLALVRWRLVGGAVAAALVLAAAVALALFGGPPSSDVGPNRGIDSGRGELISGGLELAEDRPVAGWGSGSFGAAYTERIERVRTPISHAEPVTVAAEQGLVGLAAYVPLVVVSLLVVLAGAPSRSGPRAAVAACFAVLLVHSFGYAGFVIDPATWAVLALGIALRED